MKTNKNMKRLLTFAIAAFMILGAASIVSADFYDFESDDGGWIPTADWDPVGDWEWTDSYDVSNYVGAHTPPPTAYSGDGLWGTVLYDDYTNAGANNYLSQTFDFSSVSPTEATLTFYSWSDIFGTFDYGMVWVNGVELLRIDDYNPTAWTYETVDLSAYAGNPSVTIEFVLYTTTVVEYAGWYIDDVDVAGSGGGGGGSGNDCADPIVVDIPGDLVFEDLGQTTFGKGDDYMDTDLGYYDGGEDIIYELDVTADTTIIVDVLADTSWVGAGLFTDCPDVPFTMVASDTYGPALTFTYDVLAAESPYYLMIDTWPTPYDTIFDLTISYPTNDVGATAIISPADGDGLDPVYPEAEVTNFGSEYEIDVPVHMTIQHVEGGGTLLFEDFEGSFPPADWTIVTYGGTTYEWEQWAYADTTYTYEPPGDGDYYAVAQDDETPTGTDADTGLFTPSLDMTGVTYAVIEFDECFQDFAGNGQAELRTYSGGFLEENLYYQTVDGPFAGQHVMFSFDPSGYFDPSDVQFEFWYTDDYYDSGAWGWAIDNVEVYSPPNIIYDYDETVLVDVPVGATVTAYFPTWNPTTAAPHDVEVCTEMLTDSDASNDCIEDLGVLIGFIDAGTISIDFPQALMGPVPFEPAATVENFGDFDLEGVPVHAMIAGGEEVKFSETFESLAGFSVVDREIGMQSDLDLHAGEGEIKLVGDLKGGLGDVGDWTILDLDGDLETWHQHSDANEGSYGMYNGDDVALEYNNNAFDWLISPAIDVGAAGGKIVVDLKYDTETYFDSLFIGNSPDGVSFYGTTFDGNSGGWIDDLEIPLYNTHIAPDGTTYICFMFSSDGSVSWYEGAHVDDVKVIGGGIVYDETVYVDVPVGDTAEVVFPTFTPESDDYTITVCTEHPADENSANDCDDLAFTTNAPVYILETGLGYATIQEGIDAADPGQTVIVTDGLYIEDITLDKPITLTGENIEAILDPTTCTYEYIHGSYIQGIVNIVGVEEEAPPEPPGEDCEYEVWLYDSYGDGWDTYPYGGPNLLDISVNGVVVLDDIYLATGYGPQVYTFTVEDGDAIAADYTAIGSYPGENQYVIYDSEGNIVTDQGSGYAIPGDWSGTATCPGLSASLALPTIFENFDVTPGVIFTDHEAAVTVSGSNVIVRQNTIHNVNGLVEYDMFTIKGIHVYNGDPGNASVGIFIEDNVIRDVINDNMTDDGGSGGDFIFEEGFEGGVIPAGWSETVYSGTGHWRIDTYGGDCYYSPPGSGTYFMAADSDTYNTDVFDVGLFTPSFDMTDWDDIELTLAHAFEDYAGDGQAEINMYSGGVFEETIHYMDLDGDDGQAAGGSVQTFSIDPTGYTDISDCQLEFWYTTDGGTYAWSYAIDDIELTGTYTGGSGGDTYTYGGATGVMVQGFVDDATVIGNRIEDVHSMGWCYGVEYTPTNIPRLDGAEGDIIFDQACHLPTDSWSFANIDQALGYGMYENFQLISNEPIGEVKITGLSLFYSGGWSEVSPDLASFHIDFYDDPYSNHGVPSGPVASFDVGPGLPSVATGQSYSGFTGYEWTIELPSDVDIPSGEGKMYVTETSASGGCLWGSSNDGDSWSYHEGGSPPDTTYDRAMTLIAGAGGGPGPGGDVSIVVNCNYFNDIGDGSVFDDAKYPGIMFTVDEAAIPGPANASVVTLKCNYFDGPNELAVINKDLAHLLDATLNFWGATNGPSGGVQDPITGEIADGFGSAIVDFGQVMFDPWLGINAHIALPMGDMITVEVGDPVLFDADGSYAWIFENCEACCDPVEAHMQYEWNFDDGTYSHIPRTTHVFDTPGTYYVSLMVDSISFPYHSPIMFNWDYITVEVVPAGQPLNANADGENLGQYETTREQPVTLYGSATGGTQPYTYSWDFGDGTSSTQTGMLIGDTIEHTYLDEGTYTVTLTVVDATGAVATDTSTVVVYGIEELVVNIGGTSSVAQGDAAAFTSTVAGGRGPYSYAWNFGDGFVSDVANPTHIYENAGTYTVTLTVTDVNDQTKTKTKTVTIQPSGGTSEVEITDVSGGFLLSATINSDEAVAWSIDVDGMVFFGGHADGTALGSTQVKLPFSIGFGNVDVVITAGGTQETYSAFMLGPFLLNLA